MENEKGLIERGKFPEGGLMEVREFLEEERRREAEKVERELAILLSQQRAPVLTLTFPLEKSEGVPGFLWVLWWRTLGWAAINLRRDQSVRG